MASGPALLDCRLRATGAIHAGSSPRRGLPHGVDRRALRRQGGLGLERARRSQHHGGRTARLPGPQDYQLRPGRWTGIAGPALDSRRFGHRICARWNGQPGPRSQRRIRRRLDRRPRWFGAAQNRRRLVARRCAARRPHCFLALRASLVGFARWQGSRVAGVRRPRRVRATGVVAGWRAHRIYHRSRRS